jgi:hypothetical protein
MREGSELEPTSPTSPTTALTTTRKLGHVTGTENLPPSVAREVAEIVATYQVTGADFLRHDVLTLGPRVALVSVLAVACVGDIVGVIAPLVGFCIALPKLWLQAPLTRAQQHLKESGIGWRARRRLGIKLAAIVGSTPAKDPAKRPGVDEIVTLLAPGGQDPWAPSTSMAAPAVLTPSAGDATLARSVVSHTLQRLQQERLVWVTFGALSLLTLILMKNAPIAFPVVLLVLMWFVGRVGLAVGRLMSRRVLGRMLASLGVAPAEQDRIEGALKPLLSRASLAAIPADRRQEVLAQRLVEGLAATTTPALPASSSEPSSS